MLTAAESPVLTMRRIGPPSTCYACFNHPNCEARRREVRVPCAKCHARILPGQTYRVLATVGGEVVEQEHVDCGVTA